MTTNNLASMGLWRASENYKKSVVLVVLFTVPFGWLLVWGRSRQASVGLVPLTTVGLTRGPRWCWWPVHRWWGPSGGHLPVSSVVPLFMVIFSLSPMNLAFSQRCYACHWSGQ